MEMLRAVLAIGFTFTLLLALLWVLRSNARGGGWICPRFVSGPSRRLRAVERLPLSPACTLHLLEIDNRVFVIAVAKDHVSILLSPSSMNAEIRPESITAR